MIRHVIPTIPNSNNIVKPLHRYFFQLSSIIFLQLKSLGSCGFLTEILSTASLKQLTFSFFTLLHRSDKYFTISSNIVSSNLSYTFYASRSLLKITRAIPLNPSRGSLLYSIRMSLITCSYWWSSFVFALSFSCVVISSGLV